MSFVNKTATQQVSLVDILNSLLEEDSDSLDPQMTRRYFCDVHGLLIVAHPCTGILFLDYDLDVMASYSRAELLVKGIEALDGGTLLDDYCINVELAEWNSVKILEVQFEILDD